MARIVERCGDLYRVWYTVSDTYMHAPMTREEMAAELARWGWTPENVERRIESAEVVEEWAEDDHGDPWPDSP
jgi:hypothetical protein